MKRLLGFSLIAFGVGCGSVSASKDAGLDGSGGGSGDASDAQPSDGHLVVAPLTHSFGPVPVASSSSTVTFTFTNDGLGPATGCAAPTLGGAHSGDFMIATDNCGTNDLAAGANCTVLVKVTPSIKGLRTMTLSRTCTVGGTATTTPDAIIVNRPMYIFITNAAYKGNLGGLAGADTLCNTLGTTGSVTAPLNRTWKALMSKATGGVVNAKDRFVWSGPVLDMTNRIITQNPTVWPWTGAEANAKMNANQNGGGPPDSYVWTGSTSAGVAKGAAYDCNGWTNDTSTYNGWSGQNSYYPGTDWIDSFSNSCADMYFGLWCVSE